MTGLRSFVFLLGAIPITAGFGLLVPTAGPFSFRLAAWFARTYARVMLRWVQASLGITYEVRGWENVPASPAIIMAKHQSAWETLFMQALLPPQCWIVKRELLWLPFVGWSLYAIRCIAIDRRSGMTAREQVVAQGARRLAQGMWISIFPEGTRVPPGKRGRYGVGGGLLAARTGAPILPIAHNAGELWGRYAFRKRAGRVTVVIGPLIASEGRDAVSLTQETEAWIEGQMALITGKAHAAA